MRVELSMTCEQISMTLPRASLVEPAGVRKVEDDGVGTGAVGHGAPVDAGGVDVMDDRRAEPLQLRDVRAAVGAVRLDVLLGVESGGGDTAAVTELSREREREAEVTFADKENALVAVERPTLLRRPRRHRGVVVCGLSRHLRRCARVEQDSDTVDDKQHV